MKLYSLALALLATATVAQTPAPKPVPPSNTLEERFREEAEIWDRETVHQSSTLKMVLHPSYQKIMAMGPAELIA